MQTQMKQMITKEVKECYCSLLLDELKDRVQKLRLWGVKEADIENALYEEESLRQLVITEDYQIILSGETNVAVKMEPLVKAVFLLFLSHPEGIVLKYLTDHRDELTALYRLLKPYGTLRRVEKSIDDATNPTLNSINEKCARIRRAFADVLPPNMVKYYSITGKRGDVKTIVLPRSNVRWECKLPFSQAL